MAGFSASSFKSKLEKLSESQQSIQTLSHWVQYHKKRSTVKVPPSRATAGCLKKMAQDAGRSTHDGPRLAAHGAAFSACQSRRFHRR